MVAAPALALADGHRTAIAIALDARGLSRRRAGYVAIDAGPVRVRPGVWHNRRPQGIEPVRRLHHERHRLCRRGADHRRRIMAGAADLRGDCRVRGNHRVDLLTLYYDRCLDAAVARRTAGGEDLPDALSADRAAMATVDTLLPRWRPRPGLRARLLRGDVADLGGVDGTWLLARRVAGRSPSLRPRSGHAGLLCRDAGVALAGAAPRHRLDCWKRGGDRDRATVRRVLVQRERRARRQHHTQGRCRVIDNRLAFADFTRRTPLSVT